MQLKYRGITYQFNSANVAQFAEHQNTATQQLAVPDRLERSRLLRYRGVTYIRNLSITRSIEKVYHPVNLYYRGLIYEAFV